MATEITIEITTAIGTAIETGIGSKNGQDLGQNPEQGQLQSLGLSLLAFLAMDLTALHSEVVSQRIAVEIGFAHAASVTSLSAQSVSGAVPHATRMLEATKVSPICGNSNCKLSSSRC
jgi:hypothetical protein